MLSFQEFINESNTKLDPKKWYVFNNNTSTIMEGPFDTEKECEDTEAFDNKDSVVLKGKQIKDLLVLLKKHPKEKFNTITKTSVLTFSDDGDNFSYTGTIDKLKKDSAGDVKPKYLDALVDMLSDTSNKSVSVHYDEDLYLTLKLVKE
jgi:hypothetical protein